MKSAVSRAFPLLAFLFTALLLFNPRPASARSQYAPPGLYDVEQITLPNGFRVLLKQRPQAHKVSLRLAVNVGDRHFDCEHREIPHLIEHVLASGTTKHTETEIDGLIQEHGGSWNAETGPRYTTYQVDIFDQYADIGLNLLYEFISNPVLSEEKIEQSKNIVTRELDGRPSLLRRVLYRYDIGKTAWKKANEWLLPGNGAVCRDFVRVDRLTRKSILDAFRAYYTPANMTLIIVGNFDWQSILDHIRQTFGTMPPAAGKSPKKIVNTPPYPSDGPKKVSGTFAPFLGSSGFVAIAYRVEGDESRDAAALEVMSAYLNTKLYKKIRIQNGLSYNPEAAVFMTPDYGIFYVTADSSLGKIEDVATELREALDGIAAEPPSAEEIGHTKKRILMQWVQGYETNAGIADYYVSVLHRLGKKGRFRNYEREIERISPEDIARVIKTYLREDRQIEVRGKPTLSYTQFYTAVTVVACLSILIAAWIVSRASRRKKIPWYRR